VYGASAGGIGVHAYSNFGYGVVAEANVIDAVHGLAHSNTGSGVSGLNTDANGVGVWGSSPGWAYYADGNVQQGHAYGGWVKAMVYFNGYQTPYGIVR
jgi:hypothetical protein